jgi:hypothetical protein
MAMTWADLRDLWRLIKEADADPEAEALGKAQDREMHDAVVESLRIGLDDLAGRTPETSIRKVAVLEKIAWDPAHPHRAEALTFQGTFFEDAMEVAKRRGRPAEEVATYRDRALGAYSTAVEHLVETNSLARPQRRRLALEAHTLAPARVFWMSLEGGDVARAETAFQQYRTAKRGGWSEMVDQTRRMKKALKAAPSPGAELG